MHKNKTPKNLNIIPLKNIYIQDDFFFDVYFYVLLNNNQ